MALKRPPSSRRNSKDQNDHSDQKAHSDNVWRIGNRITINKTLRVPIIIFALVLIYVAINFAVNHYNPVKTTPAVQVSMDDSFTATGYFIRDEQVIDIAEGDTVEYNYADGDKVAQGAALITQYADEDALIASRELKEIEDSIEQLQTLQSASSTSTNSSQLNQKIITQMNAISDAVESGSLSQISELASELRQLALQSGSLESEDADIESELECLEAEAASLREEVDGKTSEITSPYAGYFCESVDGYEEVLTTSIIDDLTLATLEDLTEQAESADSGKGKIISSYVWYFAASVSDSEAESLSQGDSVSLRFSQVQQVVSATVTAIRDDTDSDETLLILESQDMNSDLISMRKQEATVVIASYSGLKVPKSAVRMKDDTMGVYVLSNSTASYKTIEPLYEGEDYYIVEQKVTSIDSMVIS